MKRFDMTGMTVKNYLDMIDLDTVQADVTGVVMVRNVYGQMVQMPMHINCRCSMSFTDEGIVFKADKKEL
jgi:hypothetical protein